MAAAVDVGEASPRFFGYLEDRIRVNSGQPQLYGTQFIDHNDGNGLQPRPIEDRDGLAARRAAVRMEPFEEYEATMHEIWRPDSEPDPADPPGGD
jgi:hypothetical protein